MANMNRSSVARRMRLRYEAIAAATRGDPTGSRSVALRVLAVLAFVVRHPGNRGGRCAALGQLLGFEIRGRLRRRRTLVPLGERSQLWADVRVYHAARAAYGNPPDWSEMTVWRRVLHPHSVFIDVGANIGLYTIWAIDCGASVIAVEPNAQSLVRLRENLALNCYTADVRAVVLADRVGALAITRDLDNQNHLVFDPSSVSERYDVVRADTLDAIVGEDAYVDGLKIDVEGAELLVLRGAEQLLSRQRVGLLQIEWNDSSQALLGEDRGGVRDLLWAHGYELARALPNGQLISITGVTEGTRDVFARPRRTPSRSVSPG